MSDDTTITELEQMCSDFQRERDEARRLLEVAQEGVRCVYTPIPWDKCERVDKAERKLAAHREVVARHAREIADLRVKVARYAKHIARRGMGNGRDGACATCNPGGEYLVPDFLCVFHMALGDVNSASNTQRKLSP